MIEIEGKKFYTVLEVSQKINVTAATIRRFIKEKKLSAKKIGRTFLISQTELLKFLEVTDEDK